MLAVFVAAMALGLASQEEAPDSVTEALIACAPTSLDAAMECLDVHWPAREQYQVMSYDETPDAHFGVGMWMRNNWGLWGGGPLALHFNDIGITHPDDMSGIILESYWLRLHDCPIRLEEQVAYYQGYWELGQGEDVMDYLDSKPNLDCTAQAGANAQ